MIQIAIKGIRTSGSTTLGTHIINMLLEKGYVPELKNLTTQERNSIMSNIKPAEGKPIKVEITIESYE